MSEVEIVIMQFGMPNDAVHAGGELNHGDSRGICPHAFAQGHCPHTKYWNLYTEYHHIANRDSTKSASSAYECSGGDQ